MHISSTLWCQMVAVAVVMAAAEGGGEREGPPCTAHNFCHRPPFEKQKPQTPAGFPLTTAEIQQVEERGRSSWALLLGAAIGPIAAPKSSAHERPCRLGCFGSHVSIINIFFQTV